MGEILYLYTINDIIVIVFKRNIDNLSPGGAVNGTKEQASGIIEAMSDAINRGDNAEAVRIGKNFLDHGASNDATIYKKLYIAYHLLNDEASAEWALNEAQELFILSTQDIADFKCDALLNEVRHVTILWRKRRQKELLDKLDTLWPVYAGDKNQTARVRMIKGRIYMATGDHEKAQDCFNKATVLWDLLRRNGLYYDEQWERNDHFYEMVALAHKAVDASFARDKARNIVADTGEMKEARTAFAKQMLKRRWWLMGLRIPPILLAWAADCKVWFQYHK